LVVECRLLILLFILNKLVMVYIVKIYCQLLLVADNSTPAIVF
jgi:hypothetical protein